MWISLRKGILEKHAELKNWKKGQGDEADIHVQKCGDFSTPVIDIIFFIALAT